MKNQDTKIISILALIISLGTLIHSYNTETKRKNELNKRYTEHKAKYNYDTTYIDTLYLNDIGITEFLEGGKYIITNGNTTIYYEFSNGKMITITKRN